MGLAVAVSDLVKTKIFFITKVYRVRARRKQTQLVRLLRKAPSGETMKVRWQGKLRGRGM